LRPETNRNADSNEWTEDPELIMPPVSTNVGRVPLVKLHFSPTGSEVSGSAVRGACAELIRSLRRSVLSMIRYRMAWACYSCWPPQGRFD